MPHMIEEVFGRCNLYTLLKCKSDATKAQLRKGYYRAALKVHPDKNTGNADNNVDTTKQFQAISMAYQILQDETLRQEYDETGVIPDSNDNDTADDMTGSDAWKSYFDQIFGKVTTSKIDSFAATYKCSDEEKRDVLREFKSRQGNLVKMLDFVMLSEPRDAIRWVEDYIRPALYSNINNNNNNNIDSSSNNDDTFTDADKKEAVAWKATMEKTLTKLQKQVEKENQKQAAASAASDDQVDDDDGDNSMEVEEDDEGETETEEEGDDDDETPKKKKKQASSSKGTGSSNKKSAAAAKKGKLLQAKHVKKSQKTNNNAKKNNNNNNNNKQSGSMDDLIAQIQNKRRGGGGSNAWADLGARYGVSMNDDDDDDDNDPLNDDEFAKIQAGLGKKKKSNKVKGKR